MAYKGLTQKDVTDYREDDFTDGQIEKLNERAIQKIDKKVQNLTLNLLPHHEGSCGKELRLVLFGKTGVGKSALGNLVLGKQAFPEAFTLNDRTRYIKEECAEVDGMRVRIIDTPGFYDETRSHYDILTEVTKVMDTFANGIHGFLFVFNAETYRFTEDQQKIFALLKNDAFGPDFLKHCFMIITHGKTIQTSLHQYINSQADTPFGKLMRDDLKERVIVVDCGGDTEYFREEQRNQVVRLVASSSGSYTHEAMQKQREETLLKVDASIRKFVPRMEGIFGSLLMNKSGTDIKAMSITEKNRLIEEVVRTLEVTKDIENASIPNEKLYTTAAQVLEDKVKILTNVNFLEKMKEIAVAILEVAKVALPFILSIISVNKKR